MYKKWNVQECLQTLGSVHSTGLDLTDRGRGVSVILAIALELQFWAEKIWAKEFYLPHLHSEGLLIEELIVKAPGMGSRWVTDIIADNDPAWKLFFIHERTIYV
jgi:3-oxoacyl-[acyl-carrier-protein] synthase-3